MSIEPNNWEAWTALFMFCLGMFAAPLVVGKFLWYVQWCMEESELDKDNSDENK
jgi:hypothetical protein